jgi:putative FmdB family regulatory protein
MPVYDYECPNCKWRGELFQVAYSERGDQSCPECDEPLGSPSPGFGAIHGPEYQMQAVMGDGSHVKGHFGKEAKRRRKK